MNRVTIVIAFMLLSAIAFTQNASSEKEKALLQLDRRGEVYFRFTLKSPADIGLMSRIISLDNIKDGKVYAYANRKEFDRFLESQEEFEVLTPPSELFPVEMTDNPRQALDWNYYPTYTAYESLMAQFVTDHPDICRLVTFSTLASGRKLMALKITKNPDIQENEPEFLYTSSIHGDETTGYVLMLHLIDYLLQNYGVDQRITDMINSTEIYINPLANPDGTYKGGNSSVNGATRGNANNVDLNRNYPDPEDGQHPDGNPWQPETLAFMNFAGFHHFSMSANFHGGTEVLNYPWDTWSRLAADNDWWVYVCREYADTVHLHAPSNYMNEYENGITNGFAWYTISGGRQDYMNFFRNCREVTIEISDTKLLPANQLENHWNYNYRSFLNYIAENNYGLHGLVTDSLTGNPLNAKVYISGHDLDSSQVYTDPNIGDYHRMLKAGNYNVTFSSPGYIPKTISVQLTDHSKTIRNIQLYNGKLKTNFSCDSPVIAKGSSVQFQDLSVGNPQSWHWEFEGGTPSVSAEQNPLVTYDQPGKFTVKLVVTTSSATDSLVREDYIDVLEGYLMASGTYQVCDALFFDSGGPLGNYSGNESSVATFLPSQPNTRLNAEFIHFDIEGSAGCQNDYLTVYDGADTQAPLLGSFCNSNLPVNLIASNQAGALTFEFHSNSDNQGSGWEVLLACDSNVGIDTQPDKELTIFPNPVSEGRFRISSDQLIHEVILYDAYGRRVSECKVHGKEIWIDTPNSAGIYYVAIKEGNTLISRKLMVSDRK